MISALPTTPAIGKPPAMPLAKVTRSGSTPACSMQNHFPQRPIPAWISSSMSTMPCSSQTARSALQETGRRGVVAALSEYRFDDDRGDVSRCDVDGEDACSGRPSCLLDCDPEVIDGVGNVVDVGGERSEEVFVGGNLAGQTEGEHGATVERAVECDHAADDRCGRGRS